MMSIPCTLFKLSYKLKVFFMGRVIWLNNSVCSVADVFDLHSGKCTVKILRYIYVKRVILNLGSIDQCCWHTMTYKLLTLWLLVSD